jgi:DNA repair photolyase
MEYIPAKTIVTRTKSTAWFGASYNMNIYKGCCHGCIYCDSRSDCYRVDDFDRVRAKENALEIIRDDLRRKIKTGVVATGSMSDPYNPFEQTLMLTRHALELLDAYGFGAAIATKSDRITRDIDVLQNIREHSPVLCKITITTCDDALAQKIEPYAPTPSARFDAIRTLSKAGLFTGILLMPILPFLEDSTENVTGIVQRAAENGARFVYPAFGVTLRQNQRAYFLKKLDECFPGQGLRAQYERQFGDRYQCASPRVRTLWGAFTQACNQYGILYKMPDIIAVSRLGYESTQLRFDL